MPVIASRAANALVSDVAFDMPGLDLVPGGDAIPAVLAAFKKAYGGLWVGGRATLTDTELAFHPNAVNRAVQSGTLDIVVPLPAITGVEVERGVLTKIIAIRAAGSVVKIRCFGAREFADQIRSAVG